MQQTFIVFALLLVLCIYLVYYYSSPSVSIYVKICSVITWLLNFGIAILVPEDLFYTLLNKDNPTFKDSNQYQAISSQYLIMYWVVYILTWTIIPVLQQWQDSGDLTSNARFKRSLKQNGIFYLYMLIGGIIALIALVLLGAGGQMGLLTFLKCLALCLGIFLLMLMMGYAMAQIPKSLWQQANPEKYKKYLYMKVNLLEQQLTQAQFEFRKIVAFLNYANEKQPENKIIKQYYEASISHIPQWMKLKFPSNQHQFLQGINYQYLNLINQQSLIDHHRLIKRNIAQLRRIQKDLDQSIYDAVLYEDIHNSMENTNGKLQTVCFESYHYHFLWYCRIRPLTKKFLTVIYIIFSLIILLAQTQVFLTKQTSILGWLLKIQNLKATWFLSLFVICYISYMVYYSIFRLKLSNIYGLYKKQSDGPSLMFATINFSRVAAALIINFFNMIKMKSIFIQTMATPDMGLLGDWVIKGMPGVLWFIVLVHYFDIWGKLMRLLGLQDFFSFVSHEIQQNKAFVPYAVKMKRISFQNKKNDKNYFSDSVNTF